MKKFHHFDVIVVQKLKIFNFDTALIQNQLNDSDDFEVRFGTDFFNSTAAFLAEMIANRLKHVRSSTVCTDDTTLYYDTVHPGINISAM